MDKGNEITNDYARGLIWLLFSMTGGPLPPYLLEIVLKDGRSFYLMRPIQRNESNYSIVLEIYDFRGIDSEAEKELKENIEKIKFNIEGKEPEEIHPLLCSGSLRCNLNDISYCIEWRRYRRWTLAEFLPEDKRGQLGFLQNKAQ
jgi:hypothetical protein